MVHMDGLGFVALHHKKRLIMLIPDYIFIYRDHATDTLTSQKDSDSVSGSAIKGWSLSGGFRTKRRKASSDIPDATGGTGIYFDH